MIVALGIITGLVLGLTGAGGSVLAVPLLMLGLGWTLTQAAPVALIAVCVASGFGTAFAWDVTYIRYRAALLMAAVGFLLAPVGLRVADIVPPAILGLLFSAVLITVALRMILQARRHPDEVKVVRATVTGDGAPAGGPICHTHPLNGRLLWTRSCAAVISAIRAASGFLSGLLGVGGGFVIVPALRATTALSMHSAVATSLMAIALTSAGTVLATLLMGRGMPWMVAIPFIGGALTGMLVGRKIAPRIVGPALQQGFALLMLAAAGVLIHRSLN